MAMQPNRCTSQSLLKQAERGLHEVLELIAREEARFGRRRLLDVVNSIPPERALHHVASYRHIIRNNEWYPHPEPHKSHRQFIEDSILSAAGYAKHSFEAAEFLECPDDGRLPDVHRLAVVSEHSRGHYGKRAPDGLDARLERASEELLEHLKDEDHLSILGSCSTARRPAESQCKEDYLALRRAYSQVPQVEELVSGRANDIGWKFISHHCKWRTDLFSQHWKRYDSILDDLRRDEERDQKQRAELVEQREDLLRNLSPDAQHLADCIAALNLLNLVLEPACSFKSGPGLLFNEVFRAAAVGSSPIASQLMFDRQRHEREARNYIAI